LDIKSFLEQLPAAASSPLALGAYALVVGAWLVVAYLRQKPQREARRILAQYTDDKQRNKALASLLGSAPPEGLSRHEILEWVRLESARSARTQILIAYLATIAAILVIVVSALSRPGEPKKVDVTLHGVGGPSDCPPLPFSTELVVSVDGKPRVRVPVDGCQAEIPAVSGLRRGSGTTVSLDNSGPFQVSAPSTEYDVRSGKWFVPIAMQTSGPRLIVHLFKYGGSSEPPERRVKFDQFSTIIRQKIQDLGQDLASQNQACAYLNGLTVVRSNRELEFNARDTLEYWKKSNSLQILSGLLDQRRGEFFVRSRPFFGELAAGSPAERVELELNIDTDELGKTLDSHSLALLYALACDARRRNLPREVVFIYLARAVSIARELDSSVAGVPRLKQAIRGVFRTMGRPEPAEL
jgi:hypothetical protein